MLKKQSILSFLFALALFFLMTPLRKMNFQLTHIVEPILFFILTAVLCRYYGSKAKPGYILIAILLGATIYSLVSRVRFLIHSDPALVALPRLILVIVAILAGYAFYKAGKTSWKIVIAVATAAIIVSFGIFAYPPYMKWASIRTIEIQNKRDFEKHGLPVPEEFRLPSEEGSSCADK